MCIPAYMEQVYHTKIEAAYIVSIGGLAEPVGRLGIGFLADCHILSTHLLMALLVIIGAIAAAVTPLTTAFIPLGFIYFIFSISVGTSNGLESSFVGREPRCSQTSQCHGNLRGILGSRNIAW